MKGDHESKEHITKTLHNLQRTACAYDSFGHASVVDKKPPGFCDCKFGGHNLMRNSESGNGCPELRTAVAVLELMTPAEWERIQARGRKASLAKVKRAEKAHASKKTRSR